MHELPITESILKIVLTHAAKNDVRQVMAIHLRIGRLSDLEDEWVQRYFDYLSKGTVAQGAKLMIERTPVVFQCNSCNTSFEVDMAAMDDVSCSACGLSDSKLISGREYYIVNMEVQ